MISAGSQTDLFADPQGAAPVDASPRLLFEPEGDFIFSAKVSLKFRSTFDAGVLLLYQRETSWAKLCFEFAPEGYPLVVSVVTRGVSDDCNSLMVDENSTHLRVSRIGEAYAFHHSLDGDYWHLVRVFRLGSSTDAAVQLGFSVQSPKGEGCTAIFSKLSYRAETLRDIRSGE